MLRLQDPQEPTYAAASLVMRSHADISLSPHRTNRKDGLCTMPISTLTHALDGNPEVWT